jgi:hypothetical protein
MELIKFTINWGDTQIGDQFLENTTEMYVTEDSEAHMYLRSYCESNGYDYEEQLGTVGEWKPKTNK